MTTEHRTVVVGLDESSAARAALSWAADYARLIGARLTAVHVRPRDISPYLYAQTMDLDPIAVRTRRRIGEIFLALPPMPGWTLVDLEGNIGEELVRVSQRADLLVLGTQHDIGPRRIINTSISHYCIRHADVPVLSFPDPAATARRRRRRHKQSLRRKNKPLVSQHRR